MKALQIQYNTVRLPNRIDYIHTVEDPGGTTYSLITIWGFYPIVVVTNFGNVIGFVSFRDMRKRIGYGMGHIKLIGYNKKRTRVTLSNGEEVEIKFTPEYIGYGAITNAYDGPEDHYNYAHSMKSKEDALESLKEKLEEQIIAWS